MTRIERIVARSSFGTREVDRARQQAAQANVAKVIAGANTSNPKKVRNLVTPNDEASP